MQKELLEEFNYLNNQRKELSKAKEFMHGIMELHPSLPGEMLKFYYSIDKRLRMLQNESECISKGIEERLV